MRIRSLTPTLIVSVAVLTAGTGSSLARARGAAAYARACETRELSASWRAMSVMESSGGFVYLTNRSRAACDLKAPPRVRLFSPNGSPIAVTYRVNTAPGVIHTLILMPGQRVRLGLQWSNWCGRSTGAVPVLDLKRTNKRLPVRLPAPVCLEPPAPSVLNIDGHYDLAGSAGVRLGLSGLPFMIQSEISSYYYLWVNRHRYGGLCNAFARFGRPSCGKLAAGYRDTAHVTIDRLAVPLYLIRNGHPHAVYTCVGIQLSARQTDGSTTSYGGWYLMKQQVNSIQRTWIVLPGSLILRHGSLLILSRQSCRGHVPPPG